MYERRRIVRSICLFVCPSVHLVHMYTQIRVVFTINTKATVLIFMHVFNYYYHLVNAYLSVTRPLIYTIMPFCPIRIPAISTLPCLKHLSLSRCTLDTYFWHDAATGNSRSFLETIATPPLSAFNCELLKGRRRWSFYKLLLNLLRFVCLIKTL